VNDVLSAAAREGRLIYCGSEEAVDTIFIPES